MLSEGTPWSARSADNASQHLRGPAAVAAMGRSAATQIRAVAPLVLLSMTRVLPHFADEECPTCDLVDRPVPRLSFTEWDSGRWFVVDPQFGMLGEIELVGTCYRVSHAADAKGATFAFGSLPLAVSYFEEYAAALALTL
ncbi:hypothetical protein B7R22_16420 [Subtercola boreus]|uniref:Uncharacterized protein n=1 Tax=Subtercola boreus TaxID=120213 RepID=A0A3E0VSG6_9MICO|nr:hypothetical protein [Subtercola boreus]RFA12378.1 hypothetical protein B7R22_16420 [Subtercola boreus]